MAIGTVAAFLALATALTKAICQFAKGWLVKYVDWDDCSRAEEQCLGDNITDVFMKYLKDGEWRPMFVVGTENYNPTGVHIRASKLKCIIQDFETGDSRVGTVQELLRDTGKIFARRGLDPSVTLLADGEDDPYVWFKVNVAVVPCSPGQTVDTAIFGRNYQAYHTSRNAMILCNGQTTGLSLDKPNYRGQARYALAEYNKDQDEWREFATTTDVSKRTIAQCGTETEAEARQAIAEGKTAEVPLGPEDAPKSSAVMSLQVPIMQDKLRQPRPERAREPEPAPKKQKPSPPPSPVSGFSDKSNASTATIKVETTIKLEPSGVAVVTNPKFVPSGVGIGVYGEALPAPAAMEEVKEEPASAPLDDEEPELVALSPDDHSAGFRDLGAQEAEPPPGGFNSLGGDDEQPKLCSCSASDADSGPSFRALRAPEAPPAGGGRADMCMGDVGDALPALPATQCQMGRFFKGPFLGKLAPLQGVNLVRDPAGCPTAVLTLVVTCPEGKEPTETDVKELIKLAHKFLQCAANCEGSKVNSLFSEFSKQIGQVTESISPKAAEGIVETVKAMAGALPAGIF